MSDIRVTWTERVVLALAVWGLLALWLHSERAEATARQQLRDAKARVTQWQAQYAAASSRVVHDTVRVTRWASRTDTLRDSVLAHITDTLTVREYVTAADSTIHACRELVSDCARFRVAADSTIKAVSDERDAYHHLYNAVKPRLWDRCGLSAGYGLQLSQGLVRAGPVVALGCKLFP